MQMSKNFNGQNKHQVIIAPFNMGNLSGQLLPPPPFFGARAGAKSRRLHFSVEDICLYTQRERQRQNVASRFTSTTTITF